MNDNTGPLLLCSRRRGALNDTAIRPSVPWRSCPRRAAAVGSTHAGCLQLNQRRPPVTCRLRTRPRTDVDPPRIELPSAAGEGISSRRSRGDNLLCTHELIGFLDALRLRGEVGGCAGDAAARRSGAAGRAQRRLVVGGAGLVAPRQRALALGRHAEAAVQRAGHVGAVQALGGQAARHAVRLRTCTAPARRNGVN